MTAPTQTVDLRDIKTQLVEGHTERMAEPEAKEKDLVSREFDIELRYMTPDGERKEAVITASILDGDARALRAQLCTRLAGGNFNELPAAEQNRIYQLAWVTMALQSPPDWFLKWVSEDERLLGDVFEGVYEHDARYFRRDFSPGAKNEDGPNIRVSFSFSPRGGEK